MLKNRSDLILEWRARNDADQQALAVAAAVPKSSLSSWKTGTQPLSRKHEVRLAKELGVPVEVLRLSPPEPKNSKTYPHIAAALELREEEVSPTVEFLVRDRPTEELLQKMNDAARTGNFAVARDVLLVLERRKEKGNEI